MSAVTLHYYHYDRGAAARMCAMTLNYRRSAHAFMSETTEMYGSSGPLKKSDIALNNRDYAIARGS